VSPGPSPDQLIQAMAIVAEKTSAPRTRGFCAVIATLARDPQWRPTAKQARVMRQLAAELARRHPETEVLEPM